VRSEIALRFDSPVAAGQLAELPNTEGDKVGTLWNATGTHRGELMGISPTEKQSTTTGVTMDRIADGKFVEHWGQVDMLGMMQQLGAIPEPDEPAS
jgi:predicted ester cyclase